MLLYFESYSDKITLKVCPNASPHVNSLGNEPHLLVPLVRAVELRPHGVGPSQDDLLELLDAHPAPDGEAALGEHLPSAKTR